jgi:hypothetical protein
VVLTDQLGELIHEYRLVAWRGWDSRHPQDSDGMPLDRPLRVGRWDEVPIHGQR